MAASGCSCTLEFGLSNNFAAVADVGTAADSVTAKVSVIWDLGVTNKNLPTTLRFAAVVPETAAAFRFWFY